MRKVIAISVVLALVAGAAFAQTAVSGTVETRIRLANGSTASNDVTIGGVGVADGYVQLSGQDPDGKFGGLVRIRANETGDISVSTTDTIPIVDKDGNSLVKTNDDGSQYITGSGSGSGSWSGAFHRAFAWWKPIPQFQVFLGQDLDGRFATDPLTAWGFHQGGESFINRHEWDFWRAVFPGNWDGFGLALSFYIVQGLEINFVIPTGLPEWYPGAPSNAGQSLTYQQILGSLRLQMSYALPDLGKLFFSYIGPRADFASKPNHYGQVGGSFLFTAVEGLQAQIGVSTYIENDEKILNKNDQYYPLMVGLALHFNSGDWGVKLRAAGSFLSYGGTRTNTDSWRYRAHISGWFPFTAGTLVTFNVMPWYNFGVLAAYFDIGADIAKPIATTAAVDPYFWFNPYIKKSIGPGSIKAGLMLGVDSRANAKDDKGAALGPLTTFSIPISFAFSF